MSHASLLYLTDEAPSRFIPRGAAARVDELVSGVSMAQQPASYFIDKRPVYRRLMSKLADQRADVIAALRDEVILLIEAKVRTDQNDRTPESLFHAVIVIEPKTDLSFEEILAVTKEEHPEDFIIGGRANHDAKTIALYRGDFSSILISFGRFQKNPTAELDFSKFKITDHGMSIRLGKYEASIYPILYELDPNYRRRVNKQRKAEDKTFGACLFRARRICGLNQDDFPGVRRETIVRLENQKSRSVRASTKRAILKALNMSEEDLFNY